MVTVRRVRCEEGEAIIPWWFAYAHDWTGRYPTWREAIDGALAYIRHRREQFLG